MPRYPRPIPGKLYLHLYHGRDTHDAQLTDWGFDGPWIGPLSYFHCTYLSHFNAAFEDSPEGRQACRAFFKDPVQTEGDLVFDIETTHDLLVFGGKYYGDFELTTYHPE